MRKDPKIAAKKVLSDLGVTDLVGLSLKDVVQSLGPFVKEEKMKGTQGRIVFFGSNSIITINSDIKHFGQSRFVLAHEFGHASLHAGIRPLFNCDEDSFKQWLQKGDQEQEANEFAAELLMPKAVFQNSCKDQDFSIDLVKDLANQFQSSLTSTAIRLVEQGPYSMALVYSERNIVRWSTTNSSFPMKYIVSGSETPPESAARGWFVSETTKSKRLKSWVWFAVDYNQHKFKDTYLREAILPIPSYNGVFSFITLQ